MSAAAPLLSSLPERLRGIYRLGVNDGAGPLNGSTEFTRQFETPPVQHEAAALIERLAAHILKLVEVIHEFAPAAAASVEVMEARELAERVSK